MTILPLYAVISLLTPHKQWDDFFPGDPSPGKYPFSATVTSTTSISQSKCYILDTTFQNCNGGSSNGGAIYYNVNNGKFLVEFSTFNNCLSGNWGGALSIYNCDFISNCICSYQCYAGWGQYVRSVLGSDKQNKVIQSSVCSSGNSESGKYDPIYLWYGKQNCTLVNLTNNKVQQVSAIYYNYGSSESIISFCSLNSNTAQQYTCVLLGSGGQSYLIDKCNIINNKQKTTSYGTFYCWKKTTIKESCIVNNTGQTYLFYLGSDDTLTIINCTLPQTYKHTGASLVTNNANPTKSFIHGFTLTEEGSLCKAGPDSVGDLTPIQPIQPDIKYYTEIKTKYSWTEFLCTFAGLITKN